MISKTYNEILKDMEREKNEIIKPIKYNSFLEVSATIFVKVLEVLIALGVIFAIVVAGLLIFKLATSIAS